MTDHPIAPPLKLVQQWIAEIWHEGTPVQVAQSDLHIANRAAQWGADTELEACCEWLAIHFAGVEKILRAARRPKPPSLKEQALIALDDADLDAALHVANRAAQWGADQELEACCELLKQKGVPAWSLLRLHRRPKPQTLSSIALQVLDTIERDAHYLPEITDTIRRAILRLKQLEDSND